MDNASSIDISVVIPCLNEAETLSICVQKAQRFLRRTNLEGEILVADNGSTDGSPRLAQEAGARVVHIAERGYGAALCGGIAAARGKFIVMGDGDDSYNFEELDEFVAKLQGGADLVIGNRFAGGIEAGAMPFLHRYLGNPVLSFLGRIFFKSDIGDFHCGLRAFRKDAIAKLRLSATGMEFASEMIVKAALARLRIAEVPTTLKRDGRNRPPHLRTWRDGWRHLRFLLMFSPRWLFLYPGLTLAALGGVLQVLLYRGSIRLGTVGLDVHTMLYAAAMSIIGVQMLWFAVFSKVYGAVSGFLPLDKKLQRALKAFTLERGILSGAALLLGGLALSIRALSAWAQVDYGALDPRDIMRTAIPATTMMVAGTEFILAAFFLSILQIQHRPAETPNP